MAENDQDSNGSAVESVDPLKQEKRTFWISPWLAAILVPLLGLGWAFIFFCAFLWVESTWEGQLLSETFGLLVMIALGLTFELVLADRTTLRVQLSSEGMRLLTLFGRKNVRWADVKRIRDEWEETAKGGYRLVTLTMHDGKRVRLYSGAPHLSEVLSYAKAARAACRSKKAAK